MSEQVIIHTNPLCDLHPDHGYAVVDGRMKTGTWAYMCSRCWTEYGCGRLGTGSGQRLVIAQPPAEHIVIAMTRPDDAGMMRLSDEQAAHWRATGCVPENPEGDVAVTPPVLNELEGDESVIVLWHVIA